MAEDINSTTSEEGAGVDNSASQVAEPTSQDTVQGQSSEQGSQVDNQAPSASSTGRQERKTNSGWAQQRIMEKTIERMLSKALTPLQQRLEQIQSPPAPQRQAQEKVEIDYNDLPGSINRLVEMATKQRLEEFEKTKLNSVKTELEENLAKREARNFLKSQPEIGDDEEKLDEIKKIMKDEGLDYMAIYEPVRAIKKAVDVWKRQRINPNAPKKETLSTVTGGAVSRGPSAPSVQEMKDLQRVITSDAPEAEKQKAYERIETLSKMPL